MVSTKALIAVFGGSVLSAAASAFLTHWWDRLRNERTRAEEREALMQARQELRTYRALEEERTVALREESIQEAMRRFLNEFRVEERHFVRQGGGGRILILQERLFFREIPLSNWVEHEIPVTDGDSLETLRRARSIFLTRAMSSPEVVTETQKAASAGA